MKQISMAALSLLLFASPSLATELQITVLQKGSGDPVEGATVVLKNNGYTTTDNQGIALFDAVTPSSKAVLDELKILNQGYQTLEQSITGNPTTLTLYLRPNLAELEGLEVVEERVQEKASKIVLSANELRNAAGSQGDPIKVLQSLPGVVAAGSSNEGQAYMRGSDTQDNEFWVDDLPLGYLFHWGGTQSVINPALVSDFNVFLGGFPIEYGDKLGGVIDVKLRTPKTDRIHSNIRLGTYESSFLVEGPITENDSFYIAARRSYLDLLYSPEALTKLVAGDTKDTVLQVPKFYDMQALYRHETNNGSIDVEYFKARDQLAFTLNDAKVTDPELAGDLKFDLQSETFGINWKEQWNENISHHIRTGFLKTSSYFQIGADPYGNPFFTDITNSNSFFLPSVTWKKDDTAVTLGGEYWNVKTPVELYIAVPSSDPSPTPGGFTSQPKQKIKSILTASVYTPYIKHTKQWGDKWKTSVGLRYTYINLDHGVGKATSDLRGASPRMSVEFQENEDRLWLLSWGDYFQLPQGYQILDGFGNPQINYIRAEHRILGVEQKINNTWSVKAEIYHKPMRDLVVDTGVLTSPNNYANKGKGVSYGFDLFVKRKAEGRQLGWLSYSWMKSKRTNLLTGKTARFAGDQPHTFTAVWGQPFTGSWSDWDWGFKFQAHSGLPYTKVIGRVQEAGTGRWLPIYEEYNSSRLPFYAKLDVRMSKEVLYDTWKMKYVFDIQNVTFRQNVSSYDYEDDFSNYNNPTVVSNDIFLPYFGIEAEF